MGEDDRLRKARRPGRKINRGIIIRRHRHLGRNGRSIRNEARIALGEARAIATHVKAHFKAWNEIGNLLNTPYELRAKDKRVRICKLKTIFNFIGRIAEVQRNGHTSSLQDAKINRQPLKAIHQKNGNLVATLE